MTNVFEQYKQVKGQLAELEGQLWGAFMRLDTIEEKFKMVLEHGDAFLSEDGCYCPHIELANGTEVSMCDDLYWERRETKDLTELLSTLQDADELQRDPGEPYAWEDEAVRARLLENYVVAINLDIPVAAIIRDMLESGLRAGTWDW